MHCIHYNFVPHQGEKFVEQIFVKLSINCKNCQDIFLFRRLPPILLVLDLSVGFSTLPGISVSLTAVILVMIFLHIK